MNTNIASTDCTIDTPRTWLPVNITSKYKWHIIDYSGWAVGGGGGVKFITFRVTKNQKMYERRGTWNVLNAWVEKGHEKWSEGYAKKV